MVFHGGHPAVYRPPTIMMLCECLCVLRCQVFDVVTHIDIKATIFDQLLTLTLQVTVNSCDATLKTHR